jgi:hypothetical protein
VCRGAGCKATAVQLQQGSTQLHMSADLHLSVCPWRSIKHARFIEHQFLAGSL